MAISLISSNHIPSTGLVNSFSQSITAQAGDVIEVTLQYRPLGAASFTPVWNGQSFTEVSVISSGASFLLHRLYLVAASSTTANLTGGTSPDFTNLNYAYKVWRSSAFATPPVKSGSYQILKYTSGTFSNPTLSNTLTSTDLVSVVLATSGWDTGFGTGTATFSDDSPSVSIGEANSTAVPAIEFLRSCSTQGTGSIVSSMTKSGAHNPMYQYSTFILQETAYLVSSINGGSGITAGKTGVAAVTIGFTGLPATITTNASGVTCSSIGGTTNNPTFTISDRVDGGLYPKNGTSVLFTFTNSSESASGSQQIIIKSTETAVTLVSPITNDNTYLFGAIFTATGRAAVSNDELYYTVPAGMSDLVVSAAGEITVTNTGTFSCWVYTNSTGINYYYDVTVTESGVIINGGGLTSSGLTSSGLTRSGLTHRRL